MIKYITPKIAKAKAGISKTPYEFEKIIIADEHPEAMFRIKDDETYTEFQSLQIISAINYGLKILNSGSGVVYCCIEGRSRSPVLACLLASLSNRKYGFWYFFNRLCKYDKNVRKNSEIIPKIAILYPDEMVCYK